MAISITPFLMFTGSAQSAMDLYVSLFKNSQIMHVEQYTEAEPGAEGTIKFAVFTIGGREFKCADAAVKQEFFFFTPASSIYVECESRGELDRVFNALSQDGEVLMPVDNYGFSLCFGWLNDRYGISWQLNLAR